MYCLNSVVELVAQMELIGGNNDIHEYESFFTFTLCKVCRLQV